MKQTETNNEIDARAAQKAARAERIAEVLKEGIVAERLYEPYLAAALLGILSERARITIGEIPEELLPVTRVGPTKGLKRYYGRNLIAYIHASGGVLDDPTAWAA